MTEDAVRPAEPAIDDYAAALLADLAEDSSQPLHAQRSVADCATGALRALDELHGVTLLPDVTGATLLWERAHSLHFAPPAGHVSANGSCRLLRTIDDWLAVNLARDDDWHLLPAWLERAAPLFDWADLQAELAQRPAQWALERARTLGLPVAQPGSMIGVERWWQLHYPTSSAARQHAPHIVDLSALWAGPLCSHLLCQTGATVTKVESPLRPDAARIGSPDHFNVLNAGKDMRSIDFHSPPGRVEFDALLDTADIVISAARPRAFVQLNVDIEAWIAARPGRLWLALTGYGWQAPNAQWVAFGDDAAVAAGLVRYTASGPEFYGDAVADPLTGLHAAVALTHHWQHGRGGLLDVSLAGVANHVRRHASDLAATLYRPTPLHAC